jgi:hypothetical protein
MASSPSARGAERAEAPCTSALSQGSRRAPASGAPDCAYSRATKAMAGGRRGSGEPYPRAGRRELLPRARPRARQAGQGLMLQRRETQPCDHGAWRSARRTWAKRLRNPTNTLIGPMKADNLSSLFNDLTPSVGSCVMCRGSARFPLQFFSALKAPPWPPLAGLSQGGAIRACVYDATTASLPAALDGPRNARRPYLLERRHDRQLGAPRDSASAKEARRQVNVAMVGGRPAPCGRGCRTR